MAQHNKDLQLQLSKANKSIDVDILYQRDDKNMLQQKQNKTKKTLDSFVLRLKCTSRHQSTVQLGNITRERELLS